MNRRKTMNEPCFHLQLKGFNFTAGLLALAALKSGLRVAIEMPPKLPGDYRYEYIVSYPSSFLKLVGAVKQQQFIMKCSSLFPHLFYPSRVLSLFESTNISGKTFSLFDKMVGRDRESNFLPINTENTLVYKQLSSSFPRGALIYAYRFDRNRAVIELLHLCLQHGAVKTHVGENVQSLSVFDCPSFRWDVHTQETRQKFHYLNVLHINKEKYSLIISASSENNAVVQWYSKNKNPDKPSLSTNIIEQLKKLEIDSGISKEEDKKLSIDTIQNNEDLTSQIIDVPFYLLQEKLGKYKRLLENRAGKKIKLSHAFKGYSGSEMKHEMFRKIEDECNEKYDLAKQTGIDYTRFSRLFYRYKPNIDSMIEAAYVLMNKTRDVEEIWNEVESNMKHIVHE